MTDARFEGGPHDGQVRPVDPLAEVWYLRDRGEIHVYGYRHVVCSAENIVGLVFQYVQRIR